MNGTQLAGFYQTSRKEKNKGSFLNHKICFLVFWHLKFQKQHGFLWKRTYEKYTFCWLKRSKFSRKIPFISSNLIKKGWNMVTKFHLFKNEVNKVKKKNEIWSQNSIHFEGMKKKERFNLVAKYYLFKRKVKKKGCKILFKNLTKSTYFLCISNLTTDG